MGADSKIEWTDHTFNPWVGCTKVSPACDHCYAEAWAKRTGHPELWNGTRRRTSTQNWRQPRIWAHNATVHHERRKVFCASLADVWDNQADEVWRLDLFNLIWETRVIAPDGELNVDTLALGRQRAIRSFHRWPWANLVTHGFSVRPVLVTWSPPKPKSKRRKT